MNFQDTGIIIAKRPLQEKSSIISVFTEHHGLYSGVIKQYSKKNGDNLVPGNLVNFIWTARLHEHIGTVQCELIKAYNHHIIHSKTKLYAFNSITDLIQKAFCERESHDKLFPYLLEFLENMAMDFSFARYINLELAILSETGHQLQIDKCTVSGVRDNLKYVSPKSGCAVSEAIGQPYADKLLILPEFLAKNIDELQYDSLQITQAFNLTSYFFDRYILHHKQRLHARQLFIDHMLG